MHMQVIDENEDALPGADSRYGYPSIFKLFTLYPRNISREKSVGLNFSPMAPLRYGGEIEFNIMPNSMMFMDMKNIQLYLQIKLVHSDGTALDPDEDVGLINFPIATLFNKVDLYIQQQIVCSSSTAYAYRSVFDTLLDSDWADINGPLSEGLFHKDNAGRMDGGCSGQGRNTSL